MLRARSQPLHPSLHAAPLPPARHRLRLAARPRPPQLQPLRLRAASAPPDPPLRGRRPLPPRCASADAPSASDTPAAEVGAARLRALGSALWLRLIRPLRDFGFGRRNIWEGGVGLFIASGFGACQQPPAKPQR